MMGIFSFLFGGCGKQPAPSPHGMAQGQQVRSLSAPPEVTSESEEGFHDLVFYSQDVERLPDGSQRLRGSGTFKGRPLGLEVVLGPTWSSGSLGKNIPLVTYQGFVTFHSIGPDSDTFVQVLDALYATKLNPKVMSGDVRFVAIALGGDPRDLRSGPVKIKLFFEPDKEDDYAELFINIQLAEHRIEIREKDPDYRLKVVKALQAR